MTADTRPLTLLEREPALDALATSLIEAANGEGVNGDRVGDGKLDAARPEALMYEP